MARAQLSVVGDRSVPVLPGTKRTSATRRLLRFTRPYDAASRVDTLAPAMGILTGLLFGVSLWLAILLPLYLFLR